MPGWIHAGEPVGAVVVGGGTTLNGASQITNGGTNAGSNLTAAAICSPCTDQVTITHGKHLLSFGVWFERVQANDTLIQDQYGQVSFTNLQTFLAVATVSTYTFAPSVYAARLALARRRGLRRGHHQAQAQPGTAPRLPRRIHQRLERSARPRLELRVQQTA